jgi:hypothetical protein
MIVMAFQWSPMRRLPLEVGLPDFPVREAMRVTSRSRGRRNSQNNAFVHHPVPDVRSCTNQTRLYPASRRLRKARMNTASISDTSQYKAV